jgi:hypothetical protein
MLDDTSHPGEPGAAGMRVRRTGIALVHEGELLLRPAPGSEAELEPSGGDGAAMAQYVFPVEIEVLAPPDPGDVQAIVDLALAQLARSFEVT